MNWIAWLLIGASLGGVLALAVVVGVVITVEASRKEPQR